MSKKFIIIITFLFLIACDNNNYVPKPKGYFRIDLPKKQYVAFDSICPYTFERPVYSTIKPDRRDNAEPFWINLDFRQFNGMLHLSYKKVISDNDLYQYFEDTRMFVNKHIAKADNIEPSYYENDTNKVYGIIYDISGVGVASTFQFGVTDSTKHFLRGALYFNVLPNNDSLAPVINFIKEDVHHLIQTLRWK
ncbi:MAG: gliding motility lipoprotein GldD [Bacteroidales bacterium]|jgi:gliding motility-associated lipoprotein GldD|nr:gliding motility lipoprotein GldD [Bacteroidales bacterium]MDD4214570.1 gliding motility lipoprotein GldD [Bacteroidales bacterium]